MEQEPYIFELSETIEFTRDGDFSKTASFILGGPTSAEFALSTKISQYVTQATLDAQRYKTAFADTGQAAAAPTTKNDAAESPDSIKLILFSSKNVAFADIAEACKALFIKRGTFDGKTPLNAAAFNKISVNDFTDMICGYIANFIFPSLF